MPNDFRVEFGPVGIDTCEELQVSNTKLLPAMPVNFTVKNAKTGEKIKFGFWERDFVPGEEGMFTGFTDKSRTDEIILVEQVSADSSVISWDFKLDAAERDDSTKFNPVDGDWIVVKLNKPVPDSVNIAYLCVFNSGEWQALDWGRIQNNEVGFTEVGTGIVCLPALYLNEEIEPWGDPFIIHQNSELEYLIADSSDIINGILTSTTHRILAKSTDAITKSFLKPGKTYELSYWSDGWQSLGEKTATEKPIKFENLPSGALFWLTEKDSRLEERIFTLDEKGTQIWW